MYFELRSSFKFCCTRDHRASVSAGSICHNNLFHLPFKSLNSWWWCPPLFNLFRPQLMKKIPSNGFVSDRHIQAGRTYPRTDIRAEAVLQQGPLRSALFTKPNHITFHNESVLSLLFLMIHFCAIMSLSLLFASAVFNNHGRGWQQCLFLCGLCFSLLQFRLMAGFCVSWTCFFCSFILR